MNDGGIGAKLRIWRRSNGIKQDAMAAALGVTQATVSRRFWFHGHRVLATLAYEPCEASAPTGIEQIFHLEDIARR